MGYVDVPSSVMKLERMAARTDRVKVLHLNTHKASNKVFRDWESVQTTFHFLPCTFVMGVTFPHAKLRVAPRADIFFFLFLWWGIIRIVGCIFRPGLVSITFILIKKKKKTLTHPPAMENTPRTENYGRFQPPQSRQAVVKGMNGIWEKGIVVYSLFSLVWKKKAD